MWPYDYFNRFSGLINEFDIEDEETDSSRKEIKDKTHSIFVAIWFGKTKDEKLKQRNRIELLYRKVIDEIDLKILMDNEGDVTPPLLHKLHATIGDARKGDIKIDILGKIIESTLVICDVTPMNKVALEEKRDVEPNFNPNVMTELGIAMAWKAPDQVLIVCDSIKNLRLEEFLPFHIRGSFVHMINDDNGDMGEGLKIVLDQRLKDIRKSKRLIIKNILSKLDRMSLDILGMQRGLTFSLSERTTLIISGRTVDLASSVQIAVRNLLELGLIRSIIFPQIENKASNDSAYYFTEMGRFFLMNGLKIKRLFPKILADLFLVDFWRSYPAPHKEKLAEFEKVQELPWIDAMKILEEILEEKTARIILHGNGAEIDIIASFNEYVKDKPFETIMEEVVTPWEIKTREYIIKKRRAENTGSALETRN